MKHTKNGIPLYLWLYSKNILKEFVNKAVKESIKEFLKKSSERYLKKTLG